nr:MAG TPA: hypothetical protein [Caudoviricetes sp.]
MIIILMFHLDPHYGRTDESSYFNLNYNGVSP